MDTFNIPIIVLAAGASTRMRGRDKLLEDIDGQTLLRRQAELARSVTTGAVIVALPPRPHARYEALEGADVALLEVADAGEGMGASLRSSFAALPKGAPAAMLLLPDMPDLTESDLRCVLQSVDVKSEKLIWRGATKTGNPGHPIVFSAELFSAFANLYGDTGGQDVIAKAKDKIALIPLPDSDARRDLDTPEDWAQWRADRNNA